MTCPHAESGACGFCYDLLKMRVENLENGVDFLYKQLKEHAIEGYWKEADQVYESLRGKIPASRRPS